MSKRKSPQELMAERNPLTRPTVEPVDIYSVPQPPAKTLKSAESEKKETKKSTSENPSVGKSKVTAAQTEKPSPYSTYLFKSQIKRIKLRAVEREINDQEIVQEALEEYFKKHPL